MKTYIFVISKVQGTDGVKEVGSWGVNIEVDIDAKNIEEAEKQFNKIYPDLLKCAGWTATGIIYSTYLFDTDRDSKEYLQTFSAETKTWGGRRSGAGRPQAEEPRKSRSMKFTDEEWNRVKAAASREGVSASEYVRRRVLQQ